MNQNEQDNKPNIYIKELFRVTGLTRKEFADRIRVHPQTVGKWMSGKSEPHFVNIKIMRAVFRQEVNELDRTTFKHKTYGN